MQSGCSQQQVHVAVTGFFTMLEYMDIVQEVIKVAGATTQDARKVLEGVLQERASPLLSQSRGQLVEESVPDLVQGLFRQIRAGFIEDTTRNLNYHLLRQLQDAYGLNEYLQSCMEDEEIGSLCNTEEVRSEGTDLFLPSANPVSD